MKLNWIKVAHLGPFAAPTRLNLDARVTVLTGPNDSGKSSLLHAIYLSLSRTIAEAHQVNQERLDTYAGSWQDDPELTCEVCLEFTQGDKENGAVTGGIGPGDKLVMSRRVNTSQGPAVTQLIHSTGLVATGSTVKVRHLPQVVMLNSSAEVRDILPLAELNSAEHGLVQLGFGKGFTAEKHRALRPHQRAINITRAQDALNRSLRRLLPKGLPLEFRLGDVDEGNAVSLAMVDPVNCFVPVTARGAGIRRLLGLLGTILVDLAGPDRHTVVLLDEPETSLHADAQHSLRGLLEQVAESPFIQVVYATHSPSMINTMRPESIRILQRKEVEGKPTTVILESAQEQNYLKVRSSLGLTPADSLLYATIVLIVEGDTELLCLPKLLEKLGRAGIRGFEDFERLLPEISCVDGMGFNFTNVCRLAKLQNANPVVFLDGDMAGHKSVAKLRAEHPDVPILLVDGRREFEELVPKPVYVKAIADELESATTVSVEAFDQWVEAHARIKALTFSKQVMYWIADARGERFSKTAVMAKAVETVKAEEVDAEPLRELLQTIRDTLGPM